MKQPVNPMLRLLLAFSLLGMIMLSGATWSGTIEPISAKLSTGEEAYVLSAEFGVELGSHFEDAVSRGVPLYFALELDITRNRWYWPNEHIAGRHLSYRLAYIPLTRQYRLSRDGTLHQNFPTLGEALRMLGRVAALPVAERNQLKPGETYQVELRLSLDRQQLPKPLQVDAIANRDWQVEARVLRWQFVPTNMSAQAAAAEREAK